jgi:hypothetical protein
MRVFETCGEVGVTMPFCRSWPVRMRCAPIAAVSPTVDAMAVGPFSLPYPTKAPVHCL